MKSNLQKYKESLIERQPKWFDFLSKAYPSRYFEIIDAIYKDIEQQGKK